MPIETELPNLLKRFHLVEAIDQIRPWLETASYGDITRLLETVEAPLRRHAALLIRDLLVGYPVGVWHGAPVLIYYDSPGCYPLELPLPDCPPDVSVTSIAWLPLSALRQPASFCLRGAQRPSVIVQSNRTECVVLLMQTKGESPPEVSDEWFADAFRTLPDGRIRLSSRLIASYPEALEAGCALLAGANCSVPGLVDTPQLFISDYAYEWSHTAGQHWREHMIQDTW